MRQYSIAFWNLENLFDIENAPSRPERLRKRLAKELKGWTQAVLNRKLSRLTEVIAQLNGGAGPDVLGVCEVESRGVLEMLAERLGGALGRGFKIAHADTADNRGIDVAFLFDRQKFSFLTTPKGSVFAHHILKRTATRDLFQVNLKTKPAGTKLILIGNHWPSRLGGRFESEPYRILAGETLSYFHTRIREEQGDDTAILAMGDFNDEPFDRSLTNYALAWRSKARVRNARNPAFLNLMWPLLGSAGSHYFKRVPNMLDQFLANRALILNKAPLRVREETVKIEMVSDMTRGGQYREPIRFGRPTKNGKADPKFDGTGYSDHFPISAIIEER